jgi:hypothetical protein
MPVIQGLGRLRQEDHEFQARLCYIVRTCLKKTPKNKKEGEEFEFREIIQ